MSALEFVLRIGLKHLALDLPDMSMPDVEAYGVEADFVHIAAGSSRNGIQKHKPVCMDLPWACSTAQLSRAT